MAEETKLVTEDKIIELREKYLGKDLVNILLSETPEEFIKTRPVRGGGIVPYIPGFRFIQRLNDVFGFFWSYDVPEAFEQDGHIVAKGKLSVTIPGRTITRELPSGEKETIIFEGLTIIKTQYGGSEIKKFAADVVDRKSGKVKYKAGSIIDLGDDYKSAATDAFKKCGTELGMFLDVYSTRAGEEEAGDKVSKAQLEAIYMRGEQAGMDKEKTDKWIEEELGKKIEDAEPLDIMGLIPKLIDLAKKKVAT